MTDKEMRGMYVKWYCPVVNYVIEGIGSKRVILSYLWQTIAGQYMKGSRRYLTRERFDGLLKDGIIELTNQLEGD